MQTETLVYPAIKWLQDRPSLAKEQLENPVFSLRRCKEEIDELVDAVTNGLPREEVIQELSDVFNFLACAEYILLKAYQITPEEVEEVARYKYSIRGDQKYPSDGYQNGTPPHEQLRADANTWFFLQTYFGTPEQGLGGERY
jgi:NTP pyrophosphatase (non-canonical NTP hydrolase)